MKKQQDYTNPERLKDYAIWYYSTYTPSLSKLEQKLLSKNQDPELIKRTLDELGSFFVEEEVIGSKVRNLLEKGKSRNHVISKLVLKGFSKKDIEKCLDENDFEDTAKDAILRKIMFMMKTRSLQKIRFSLASAGSDLKLVDEVIEENDLHDSLDLITEEAEALFDKGFEKQKIIERLSGKGFKFDHIRDVIKRFDR